jgi:hypothetical protein
MGRCQMGWWNLRWYVKLIRIANISNTYQEDGHPKILMGELVCRFAVKGGGLCKVYQIHI